MTGIGIGTVFGFRNAGVTGPRLKSASTVDSTTVRVYFNRTMRRTDPADPNDVLNLSNWNIDNVGGGVAVNVSSVTVYQDVPTVVDLGLDGEMTDGLAYEVETQNLLTDSGQPLDPGYENYEFVGEGELPRVLSVVGNSSYVRMTFSEAMSDVGLTTPGNYLFGGPSVLTVDHVDKQSSTVVDVYPAEEQEDGGAYTLTVSNVEDQAGNSIDPAHDFGSFTGTGVSPRLIGAGSRGLNTVRLTFSETVDTATANDAGNYSIVDSGGNPLAVSAASKVANKQVDLTTAEQTLDEEYTVTVTGVEDLAGNEIQPPDNEETFLGIGRTYPIITILPENGTIEYERDGYATVNVKDSPDYFSGINRETWQVYFEYEVNVTGTPQTVKIDVVVDGEMTKNVQGGISGNADGYSGMTVRFRPWGNSNWPSGTEFTITAVAEDLDGYETTEESEFTSTAEEPACDLSYMWSGLVPPEYRRLDPQNDDALLKYVRTIQSSFEWICGKTAEFPEQIRDPLVCRTVHDENVSVELLTATAYDEHVTLEVNGELSEVSKGWILDDGQARFLVKAVRKYIPGVQDPAEIDIEGEIEPQLGTGKVLRPMALLPFLAADFGLEVDENEVEGFQRSSVANAVQWLGLKGSEKSFRIRGLISGFEVTVFPLYSIPESMTDPLPAGTWWKIGGDYYTRFPPTLPRFDEIEGDSGLLDTFCWEGIAPFKTAKKPFDVTAVSNGWRVTFDAVVADLKPMLEVGNWKLVDSRDGSEVLATGDGSEVEFSVSVGKPVISPGTLTIQYTAGGVTKTITDDGFGGLTGDVDSGGLNEVDYETGELDFKCSEAPDSGTDIEAWYYREFWIEDFSDAAIQPWVEVGAYDDPPEIGVPDDFALRYVCQESIECWYCKTAKLRVRIEPGDILDEPGEDVGSALARMTAKLKDVTPAHVELAQVVYKTYVEAEMTYSVEVDLSPLTVVWAPMRDQFDGITADE